MAEPNADQPPSSDLLAYLDLAAKFRSHEFNIQIARTVIFTGAQGVLLACYAAAVYRSRIAATVLATFGVVLTVFWCFYYRASLYWVRYWENRCREVNDLVVRRLGLQDVSIFRGHPAGSDEQKTPPVMKYGGGQPVRYSSVSKIIRAVLVVFPVLWAVLTGAALWSIVIGP